jgi:hypothetical protein
LWILRIVPSRAVALFRATTLLRDAFSVDGANIAAESVDHAGEADYDASMQLIDKPERARQLARAIASDLTLYHEKEIVEGIENDTLFDVMKEHIEEGRTLFKSRVTPEIYDLNLYDRAIVDVMIKSKGHVKSKIW